MAHAANLSAGSPAARSTRFPRLLRATAHALTVVVLGNSIAFAAGHQDPAAIAEKFRQKVAARGIGKGMEVTETNGIVVMGVVSAIHDDTFELTPKATMQPAVIPYTQVASLHNTGMSTGAKVGIGVAVGVAGFVLVCVIIFLHDFGK